MSTNPYEPPQFAQTPFGTGPGAEFARAKVQGPAIALLIFAVVFGLFQVVGRVLNVFLGVNMFAALQAQGGAQAGPEAAAAGQGVFAIVASVIGIVVAGVIVSGALKMKNLQSQGLAVTGAVLAALPCISPCCVIGLPIGIWAVVTLSDPQVKAAFH